MSSSTVTLTRATTSDVPQLMQLMYDSFSATPVAQTHIMGVLDLEQDFPKVISQFTKTMLEDPTDIWIKIVDSSTNELVAAANWKLWLGSAEIQPRYVPGAPKWLTGEVKEQADQLIHALHAPRVEQCRGPFLHLYICFTSAAHRRRKFGSMLMQWGCELADLLQIPAWIEASPEGNFLYKKFDFYDADPIMYQGRHIANNMRRDPKIMREG